MDSEEQNNVFSTGNVKIELNEPLYSLPENEEKRREISAGDSFIKDPSVTNKGKSDCYVFLELEIPKSRRLFIDKEGQKLPEKSRNLFQFKFNENWKLVEEKDKESCAVYRLAYAANDKLTVLPAGEKTETVFKDNKVKLADVIELPEKENFTIPVRAYGIQTTDLKGTDGTGSENPEEVYTLLLNQMDTEQKGKEGKLNDL